MAALSSIEAQLEKAVATIAQESAAATEDFNLSQPTKPIKRWSTLGTAYLVKTKLNI